MRHRLYFTIPDVSVARRVQDDLLLAHVEFRRMHFLARRGTDLADLSEAGLSQKSDLFHSMEIGLVVGALAGAAAGILLSIDPMLGVGAAPGKILLGMLAGALFGVWVAGMIGVSTPNSVLKKFDRELQDGRVLLILDVPREQLDELRLRIISRHPEVREHGFEATVPAFP